MFSKLLHFDFYSLNSFTHLNISFVIYASTLFMTKKDRLLAVNNSPKWTDTRIRVLNISAMAHFRNMFSAICWRSKYESWFSQYRAQHFKWPLHRPYKGWCVIVQATPNSTQEFKCPVRIKLQAQSRQHKLLLFNFKLFLSQFRPDLWCNEKQNSIPNGKLYHRTLIKNVFTICCTLNTTARWHWVHFMRRLPQYQLLFSFKKIQMIHYGILRNLKQIWHRLWQV